MDNLKHKMHRLLFIIFLSLSLFANEEKPKKIDYVNEISILFGNSENGFEQNIGRSPAYEMQFQYNGLDFPIKPEIAFVYSQDIPLYFNTEESHTRYSLMMINGVYEVPYSDLMTPYIKGGTGYVSFANIKNSPESTPFLDTGAGLKMHLSDRWALKFEAVAIFGADHFNLLVTGGVNFAFGRKYVAPPPEKVCEACPVVEPVIIIKKEMPASVDIRFVFSKAKLTDLSKESIKEYSRALNNKDNLEKSILIVGYADSSGPQSFNATLSLRRATAVRNQFIANGVDPERITIDGHGENAPIASNDSIEGREKNRSVIVILKSP